MAANARASLWISCSRRRKINSEFADVDNSFRISGQPRNVTVGRSVGGRVGGRAGKRGGGGEATVFRLSAQPTRQERLRWRGGEGRMGQAGGRTPDGSLSIVPRIHGVDVARVVPLARRTEPILD